MDLLLIIYVINVDYKQIIEIINLIYIKLNFKYLNVVMDIIKDVLKRIIVNVKYVLEKYMEIHKLIKYNKIILIIKKRKLILN